MASQQTTRKAATPVLPWVISSMVTLAATGTLVAPGLANETNVGTPRALLIGINDYQNLPPLNGALNDVKAVRHMLMTRHGFASEQITTLTDGEATRAGILAALTSLAATTQGADPVYIHYSGHGSQVEDLDGDEDDGMDETISPQDARSEGIADITDDELDRAFAQIGSKRLIITLDSCHSGTGLRGGASRIRQRFVPADTRLHLYRGANVRTRAVVPLPPSEPYVLFTGAAAHQSALDGPFNNGRYHGLFTYAYTQAFARLPANANPREIMAEVAIEMTALRTELGGYLAPEPQLEGPAQRLDAPLLQPASVTMDLESMPEPDLTSQESKQPLSPQELQPRTRSSRTLLSR